MISGNEPLRGLSQTPVHRKAAAAQPSTEAEPSAAAEPRDTLETSAGGKISRGIRRGVAKVSGLMMGTYSALTMVPQGIAGGILKAVKAKPNTEAVTHATTSSLTHLASGAAIGGVVMGVPGACVGALVGFIGGVIGNFLNARSGMTEQLIQKVDKAANKALKDHEDDGRLSKLWHTAKEGAEVAFQHGWKSGKTAGEAAGAGAVDGLKFVHNEVAEAKEEKAGQVKEEKPFTPGEVFRRSFGMLGAFTGAMINLPGSIVYGALESMASPDETTAETENREQTTRTLMHWATNVGKMLPAIGIGLALGGPLGVGVGVGYGLITSSLRSIIDGRTGVDYSFASKVDRALNEVNADEDLAKGGHRVFYRASKGVAAATHASVTEGWKLGAQSGYELADGLIKNPLHVLQGVFNKVREPQEEDKPET